MKNFLKKKNEESATAPPLPLPIKGRGMAAKGTKGQKVDIS
jgi:hypothetical protein